VLLSHCRTGEKAAQRSISARQEHMAERQVNHSQTQLGTEVESSAPKFFGAYSLVTSSNGIISNCLILNGVWNKKKKNKPSGILWSAKLPEHVPSSATPRSTTLAPCKSAVTPTPGTAARLRGDKGRSGQSSPNSEGQIQGLKRREGRLHDLSTGPCANPNTGTRLEYFTGGGCWVSEFWRLNQAPAAVSERPTAHREILRFLTLAPAHLNVRSQFHEL